MPRQAAATSAPPAPAAAPTCAPATRRIRDNPHGLCDPCHALVASCAPYVDGTREPAPPDVNLVELVAGLALTHDALHPGEPLYLREALAAHGVEADHVKIWQTVGKLRRRHGLVMTGEPREPGYRVEDWVWEAKRVRSTVRGG